MQNRSVLFFYSTSVFLPYDKQGLWWTATAQMQTTFNHTHDNNNTSSVITDYRHDHYHMKHLNQQHWLNQNDQII